MAPSVKPYDIAVFCSDIWAGWEGTAYSWGHRHKKLPEALNAKEYDEGCSSETEGR